MIGKTKLLLKLILCSILVTYGTTSYSSLCRDGDWLGDGHTPSTWTGDITCAMQTAAVLKNFPNINLTTSAATTCASYTNADKAQLAFLATSCCTSGKDLCMAGTAPVSAVTSADNFCRNQGDFNATETTVPGGTDTCSALSTILLDKLSGSPSTWSAVTCENLISVFSTSWEDTRTPGVIWNVAEVLWTYGARCCGSAYKTLLGKTCHGCIDIAKGAKANSNGLFTASGSTKTFFVAPGNVAPSSGKFCVTVLPSTAKQGTCKVASWTNKKYGDTTAAAPYSTCDTCTVLVSTTKYKTCKAYCAAQTGSLTCAGAWDDMLASCLKKKMNGKVILPTEFTSPLTCNSTIKNDMICKCCPASGCPATTSGSSRSSSAGLVVGIVVGIAVAIAGA